MRSLKAIALLLEYPDDDIIAATDELLEIVDSEGLLPEANKAALADMIEARRRGRLMDAQADYVALFDSLPGASLYLFQHLYGDSRDRGPALLELTEMYQSRGLEMATRETADYIPLFLEFVSQLPPDDARELIGQVSHVFEILRRRLSSWHSPYAAAFAALVAIAGSAPDQNELDRLSAQKVRGPDELASLDRDWEEQPVEFTEGSALESQASCGSSGDKGGCAQCRA